jgi:hypothetical protein
MSFLAPRGGDRFGPLAATTVPKAFVAANYPAPAAGDLIRPKAGGANDEVVLCLSGEVPVYMVRDVNSNNGTLSVFLLSKLISLEFQYSGPGSAVIVGQSQIQADPGSIPAGAVIPIGGVNRTPVKPVASPLGIGLVTARDSPQTGLLVVEFHGAAT